MAQTPSDAGKTSGGGSLGHDQPDDVVKQTPIRNDPRAREDAPPRDDNGARRRDDNEARRRDDNDARRRDERNPVMPAEDPTLKTKL